MTDTQYLAKLEELLRDLPQSEKEEALNFVQEYFEEARDHAIENPASHLGSPEDYARTIREGLKGSIPPQIPEDFENQLSGAVLPHSFSDASSRCSSTGRIWLIVLSPFIVIGLFTLFMLVFALAMMVLALLAVSGGIVLSGILGCFVLLYKAVTLIPASIYGAMFDLGCALFSLALAYFAFLLLKIFFTKGLPCLAGTFKRAFAKIKTWFLRIWKPARKQAQ